MSLMNWATTIFMSSLGPVTPCWKAATRSSMSRWT